MTAENYGEVTQNRRHRHLSKEQIPVGRASWRSPTLRGDRRPFMGPGLSLFFTTFQDGGPKDDMQSLANVLAA